MGTIEIHSELERGQDAVLDLALKRDENCIFRHDNVIEPWKLDVPERELAIGDIVLLKSGGPLMTVATTGQKVTCIWYAGRLLGQKQSLYNRNDFDSSLLVNVSTYNRCSHGHNANVYEVVVLNSGGPPMTVQRTVKYDLDDEDDKEWFKCIWFSDDLDFQIDDFLPEMLTSVNDLKNA